MPIAIFALPSHAWAFSKPALVEVHIWGLTRANLSHLQRQHCVRNAEGWTKKPSRIFSSNNIWIGFCCFYQVYMCWIWLDWVWRLLFVFLSQCFLIQCYGCNCHTRISTHVYQYNVCPLVPTAPSRRNISMTWRTCRTRLSVLVWSPSSASC